MGAVNKDFTLQLQLLESLLAGELGRFQTLLREPSVHPNYEYKDVLGQFGTCLEVASRQSDRSDFVSALLPRLPPSACRAVPGPIHFSSRAGNPDTLKLLLDDGRADINAVTNVGWSALHFIAIYYDVNTSQAYDECIGLLLSQSDIDVNIPNKKGYTPIHQAAIRKNRKMVELMLKNCKTDLDLDTSKARGRTARDTIMIEFPDLTENLPPPKLPNK